MEESKVQMQIGAVTFLDVLGWKGIWRSNKDAIDDLRTIVEETKDKSGKISKKYFDEREEFRGSEIKTEVLSISDTIAIFTAASASTSIKIHAEICAWLLPYALERRIPFRGAISFGEFNTTENIMLGYAVDEAASWHESTDWIGVSLTPSAFLKIKNENPLPNSIVEYNNIPFKKKEPNLNLCIDWSIEDIGRFYALIEEKGPHTPEIASKYLNTLAFLERSKGGS